MIRRRLFIFVPIIATLVYTSVLTVIINWNNTNLLVEVPWLIILTILNFNLFLITFAACFSFWSIKDKKTSYAQIKGKSVALVYSVKNEEDLYSKISTNIRNNRDVLNEVVIISNSNKKSMVSDEKTTLSKIKREFGIRTTHFPATPPKHMGIYAFVRKRKDIKYMATCDADTIFPKGTIKELMLLAYHPENKDVAIWQTHSVASAGVTRFGRVMGAGQNICAKLYAHGFYIAIGESGYYGSGALVDREAFAYAANIISKSYAIKTKNIQSHDVWEATVLPKLGKHVKYIKDIQTYEDFPQTYVEMINRDRRWMKGTLQSIRSLLIKPTKNTIATYFYVLNPIMLYLVQPLYLVWMMLGVLRFFYTDTTNLTVQLASITFTLTLLFMQKFLAARSLKDVRIIFVEQFFSSIFYINTPVFTTINLLMLFVKEEWVPMAKKAKQNRFVTIINKFMVNQVLGYWGILFVYFNIDPRALVFFPIFFLFMISGVISYYFQFGWDNNEDGKASGHDSLQSAPA